MARLLRRPNKHEGPERHRLSHLEVDDMSRGLSSQHAHSGSSNVLASVALEDSPSTEAYLPEPSVKRARLSSSQSISVAACSSFPSSPHASPPPTGSVDSVPVLRTSPTDTLTWHDLTPAEQEHFRVECQKILDRERQVDPEMGTFLRKNGHPFLRAVGINRTCNGDDAGDVIADYPDLLGVIAKFKGEVIRCSMQSITLAVAERYYHLVSHGM